MNSSNFLVSRMQGHMSSIFAEYSAMAIEFNAINLGQGFPDTDGPDILKSEANKAISLGFGNQYPPTKGIEALRKAIANHQKRFYGIDLNYETEICVTTGASEALAAAILAIVEQGDEVITIEPWFDIYAAQIALAGGVRVPVQLNRTNLRPDITAIEKAITPKTKVLLINSPHNPTGIVFTLDELSLLARIAIRYNLIVISDEAYEHLWYDDHPHLPIASLPGMFERTITIGSGGKTFSFTGWKVGWGSGPAKLISAFGTIRQHLSFTSGGPFQWALSVGLELEDSYFEDFRHELQQKRDHLTKGLQSLGMDVYETQGTYFVASDVQKLGYKDGIEFCRDLPTRAGVVAIPIASMCDDPEPFRHLVRWAFCEKTEVLDEAVARLAAAF